MLSKWKNLKRWQKWAIVLVCLAVLGKVFEVTGLAPKTETEPVKTVQTASSSSKAKPKTLAVPKRQVQRLKNLKAKRKNQVQNQAHRKIN